MANQTTFEIQISQEPVYEVQVVQNPIFEIYVNNGAKGDKGDKGDSGTNGIDGQDGLDGEGVASGGFTGQYLVKLSEDDFDTGWATIDSTQVAYGDGTVSEALQSIQQSLQTKTSITISETEPENPNINDLWLEI